MDIKSIQSGLDKDYFWYRGKLDLIDVLLKNVVTSRRGTRDARILNVGVGSGDDLALLSRYGKVYAIDINEEAIQALSPEACFEKKVCSVSVTNYPDDYFDIVILFDVLACLEDCDSAIQEMKRILKPGGKILVTVPAMPSLYSAHDKFCNNLRRYSKKMLSDATGILKCETQGYWMFLLFLPIAMKKMQNRDGAKLIYVKLPAWVNNFFYGITRLEIFLIRMGVRFPFGTTLYGVYKK